MLCKYYHIDGQIFTFSSSLYTVLLKFYTTRKKLKTRQIKMMTGILWRFVSFGTIELAVHTCTLWTLLTWNLLKQIKKKKKSKYR